MDGPQPQQQQEPLRKLDLLWLRKVGRQQGGRGRRMAASADAAAVHGPHPRDSFGQQVPQRMRQLVPNHGFLAGQLLL